MNKVTTADKAVGQIPDGATVATVGVIGWITPDT
jgi:acyl CoA:acetate/3-ketoacid CoA transferase alpha subunit